ncbi:beta-glucosidase [Klebsiella michiganensis]|nr:beta-glucosidase [Klebsiella michiganensis]
MRKRFLPAYHHKVTRWFTFNEPIVVQTRVYLDALRWPYEQNTGTWMQWNHHKVLATAKVVRLFREKGYRGTVGCILNPEVTYPRSKASHDVRAAERYDLFYNRVFLDPLVHGLYRPSYWLCSNSTRSPGIITRRSWR